MEYFLDSFDHWITKIYHLKFGVSKEEFFKMAARRDLLIDRVAGFFNYCATDSVCDISEKDN